jgi:hypothetical protein
MNFYQTARFLNKPQGPQNLTVQGAQNCKAQKAHEELSPGASQSDELFHTVHCHTEYEVFYFKQGNVERQNEGCLYKPVPESIMLISPNTIHGVMVKSSEPYERVSIHFSPGLLEKEELVLLDMFQLPCSYYPNLSPVRMDILIQSIVDCKDMGNPLQKISLKIHVLSLLTHIYRLHSQMPPILQCKTNRFNPYHGI